MIEAKHLETQVNLINFIYCEWGDGTSAREQFDFAGGSLAFYLGHHLMLVIKYESLTLKAFVPVLGDISVACFVVLFLRCLGPHLVVLKDHS